MQLRVERHGSPLGPLLLVTSGDGVLRALDFEAYQARMVRLLTQHYGAHALAPQPVSKPLARVLEAYFAGQLSALDALPTATGGTLFQRMVWRSLRGIAAGTTLSYGELAARVGQPGAARAVGLANGKNPIAIVVPCHRVIGADGSLTGYAGGVERKRWLLDHEGSAARAELKPAPALAL